MDWVAIGGRIRKQREYLGLTREQFAEKLDICINRSDSATCTDFFRHRAGDFLPPYRSTLPLKAQPVQALAEQLSISQYLVTPRIHVAFLLNMQNAITILEF